MQPSLGSMLPRINTQFQRIFPPERAPGASRHCYGNLGIDTADEGGLIDAWCQRDYGRAAFPLCRTRDFNGGRQGQR